MSKLETAINEFRQTQLGVYKVDPGRIVSDAGDAESVTRDHVGRWLFELLQNCDDAKSRNVKIVIADDAVYLADKGKGLELGAISAICSTHRSNKPSDTIGRKGVGFKSVYNVSEHVQVFAVNEGGIDFSPDKTKTWLNDNGFKDEHVPYQSVPFFIPWDEEDCVLNTLKDFKTIVALRNVSNEQQERVRQLLEEWPPHALFSFRHLRKIEAPELEIHISPGRDIWKLRDSRENIADKWRITKHNENAPEAVLKPLNVDERKAVTQDGVSFLIAAPVEKQLVIPTDAYLPVHVFYPTEEKGPVRLLLHAEFVVKSDRTTLVPISSNDFNRWVSDRLAFHVCEFVNSAYKQNCPSAHIALLTPFEDKSSHPVAEALWQCIAEQAKAHLKMADEEGVQRLTVREAAQIKVSVRPDLARKVLAGTRARSKLLHQTFDDDTDAQKALDAMGCDEIKDEEVFGIIEANAESRATDFNWIWACWEWLAAWVEEKDWRRKERIETVSRLPIVPMGGLLQRPSQLFGRIVTWRADSEVESLPEWLPLNYVDDWFRDRIADSKKQEDDYDEYIVKLTGDLNIKAPGGAVVQRAVGQAIGQYWKEPSGDPARFLRFIREQDWYETSVALLALQRCPVRLSPNTRNEKWTEARQAYFGREWGNALLADLYESVDKVAWIKHDKEYAPSEELRAALEWLGVADCPRVTKESGEMSLGDLPVDCSDWKVYLQTANDQDGRDVAKVNAINGVDHLSIASLKRDQTLPFVRLLAKHWDRYYSNELEITAMGTRGRERDDRKWQVKSKWWWEVCERLTMPMLEKEAVHVPLTSCWLPDRRTWLKLGELLPVIDIEAFSEDKNLVGSWLESAAGLRTRAEELTLEEWKELLSKRIPEMAPVEHLALAGLRDKVAKWYAACLDTVAENDEIEEKALDSCPLLCRKGDTWQYLPLRPTAKERRYLADSNELAKAFAKDIWLFDINSNHRSNVVKYFGLLPMSRTVKVRIEPGEPRSPLEDTLQESFRDSLQYIWVWRSSRGKQDTEDQLMRRLKRFRVHVVPTLKANLTLGQVQHQVDRPWDARKSDLFLRSDHINEAALAQSLAKALGTSEADFYENLFRCGNSAQRKEKLLSKGLSQDEVDRGVREYCGFTDDSKPPMYEKPSNDVGKTDSTTPGVSQIKPAGAKPSNGAPGGREPGESPAEPTAGSGTEQRLFCLKDVQNVTYVIGNTPQPGQEKDRSHDGGQPSDSNRRDLTEAEKAELEKAGRLIAYRELQKLDYVVEVMPPENPGFDLLGRGGDGELRVEVKAHLGKATVAELTQRQYKEYLGQNGFRWELWNVERLANRDTEQVTLTRYTCIPDEALDARTFRVDLRKCQSE